MEQKIDDLRGMSPADAKEYIFRFITTLKLTEKNLAELEAEQEKWRNREELARDKGAADLAEEAHRETERIQAKTDSLSGEAVELRAQIATMRRQLPALAAGERSIDPDLLEQELNIVLGKDLTGDSPAGLDRQFEDLNAGAALDALKAKMGLAGGGGADPDGEEA
jgi:chromosome segregation ATPase